MSKPVSLPVTFATITSPVNTSQLDSNYNALLNSINDFSTYGNYLVDSSGTANLITVTTPTNITFSYTAGVPLQILTATTNTSMTVNINVNGLGNKGLYTSAGTLPGVGSIPGNSIITVVYDGFNFRLTGSNASGTTFTTVVTAGSGLAGSYTAPQFLINAPTYGIGVDAFNNVFFKNSVSGAYNFYTAQNSVGIAISSTNAVSIAATTGTGITFSVIGGTGSYTAQFNPAQTVGSANGVLIRGGSNSSDYALLMQNYTGATNYLYVKGDGGAVVGAPTGGSLGVGTLNAVGLYVNGVSVGTSSGGVTSLTAGTGITLNASTGAVTITASGAGVSSLAGTTNEITVSAATGAVTLSLPSLVDLGASSSFNATALNQGGAPVYAGVPQNAITASYTTVLADANKHLRYGGSATATITIAANASVAYPLGTVLTFANRTTYALSIAINTDTLVFATNGTTGTRSIGSNGMATALKTDSTVWLISGAGIT